MTANLCQEEARALVAQGVSLTALELREGAVRDALNTGDFENEEAEEFLFHRHTVLCWAIAEAVPQTKAEMAVKVRLWQSSIRNGSAAWDDRLAETLLEALTEFQQKTIYLVK